MNEDLVHQIAAALTAKLLAPINHASLAQHQSPALLLVADPEELAAAQAIINQQVIKFAIVCLTQLHPATPAATAFAQQCTNAPLIVISHPSLTLVSQLAYAHADNCYITSLLAALNQKKRVVVLENGIFAQLPLLPSALAQAITQLQEKLQSLGVEFCSAQQLPTLLSGSIPSRSTPPAPTTCGLGSAIGTLHNTGCGAPGNCSCGCKSKTGSPINNINNINNLNNHQLPIDQHPSQYRLGNTVAAIVDCVTTKPCTMEPGKPCDNCDICNTLGF